MRINEQIVMHQLVNKGILCSESVKAKMNGSSVASLDRFSTKNGRRLPVEASELHPGCSVNYFLTQTHFNELSQLSLLKPQWRCNILHRPPNIPKIPSNPLHTPPQDAKLLKSKYYIATFEFLHTIPNNILHQKN